MNIRNDRATWIKGRTAKCSITPKPRLLPPRLVLLGAPGSGKKTQAEYLCAGLGVCHLATSDVLRAAKNLPPEMQTAVTTASLAHLRHGDTVPDRTVLDLVRERIGCLHCQGGFLLDGFPRNVAQAVSLDQMLEQHDVRLEAVLHYTVSLPTMVHRLSGRRTCPACKVDFHPNARPPKVAEVCDYCGTILMQREDDQPGAIAQRVSDYEHRSKPLLDYYLEHGILRTISAEGSPERIYERTLAILDN